GAGQPRGAQGGQGQGTGRGAGLRALVPAALPVGLLTDRRGLLEDQDALEEGRHAQPRCAHRGDRPSPRLGDDAGRPGLVRALRLPDRHSTTV
ncbi:MAG: hypothetical protein AVDCRST_MAG80-654, partial [uncultured Rubrobacteraceae bacterium]